MSYAPPLPPHYTVLFPGSASSLASGQTIPWLNEDARWSHNSVEHYSIDNTTNGNGFVLTTTGTVAAGKTISLNYSVGATAGIANTPFNVTISYTTVGGETANQLISQLLCGNLDGINAGSTQGLGGTTGGLKGNATLAAMYNANDPNQSSQIQALMGLNLDGKTAVFNSFRGLSPNALLSTHVDSGSNINLVTLNSGNSFPNGSGNDSSYDSNTLDANPLLQLSRFPATGGAVDSDTLGWLIWNGGDANDNYTRYFSIRTYIDATTPGSAKGHADLMGVTGAGLGVGDNGVCALGVGESAPGGGYMGAGTINVFAIYDEGTAPTGTGGSGYVRATSATLTSPTLTSATLTSATLNSPTLNEASLVQPTLNGTSFSAVYNHQFELKPNTAYNASPQAGWLGYFQYDSSGDYASAGGMTVSKVNSTSGDYGSYTSLWARTNGSAVTEAFRVYGNGAIIGWASGASATPQSAGSLALLGGVYTDDAAHILHSTTTITGGGTSNSPTLTAGPVSGNPTKWLPYDDNGTTRYIPAW
jgi:hypothetical protein